MAATVRTRKKFRYFNVGYCVSHQRVGLTQYVYYGDERVTTVFMIKVDGDYKKATQQEFIDHCNAKAAEARKQYLESLEEE